MLSAPRFPKNTSQAPHGASRGTHPPGSDKTPPSPALVPWMRWGTPLNVSRAGDCQAKRVVRHGVFLEARGCQSQQASARRVARDRSLPESSTGGCRAWRGIGRRRFQAGPALSGGRIPNGKLCIACGGWGCWVGDGMTMEELRFVLRVCRGRY